MFSVSCQKFCFLQFLLILFISSVEIRIISSPKARPILVNGAVRKGDRLVPPSALEILMRITFPAPSARVKVGFMLDLLHEIPLTQFYSFQKFEI